jgi:O-acetyl-ADP-ribose deacetylase (regulator of RNase III)
MFRKVAGDILLSKADVLAHGIAPQDHFDSGLALALRERWPSLVRDFRHAAHGANFAPGTIWAWAGVAEDGSPRRIVNLLTQTMIGEGGNARPGKATLENVGHALKALAKYLKAEGIKSLALPRLATGVGDLSWRDVEALITQHLGNLDIAIIIYETYRPGITADEGLD